MSMETDPNPSYEEQRELITELKAQIRTLEMRLLASRSARAHAESELKRYKGLYRMGRKLFESVSVEYVELRTKFTQLAEMCDEGAKHLIDEVKAGDFFGEFKHPKEERIEVLSNIVKTINDALKAKKPGT